MQNKKKLYRFKLKALRKRDFIARMEHIATGPNTQYLFICSEGRNRFSIHKLFMLNYNKSCNHVLMYLHLYVHTCICNQNRGFEHAYFVFAWRLLWDVVRKNDMKILVCLIPAFANIWTLILRILNVWKLFFEQ